MRARCDHKHRNEEARTACLSRQERRFIRERKKQAEAQRRKDNNRKEPPADLIRRMYGKEGASFSAVLARLNRDYPPPEGQPLWRLWDVVLLDSKRLKWPTKLEGSQESGV